MTNSSAAATKTKRTSRWLRRFSIVGVVLIVFLAVALPTVIARTGIRDWLINSIIAAPNLSASTERASFGWFSPLSIKGMQVDGKQHRFRVDVASVTADRSWPRLLASSPDLGTILIEKPHVWLTVPVGEWGTRSSIISPTFNASISDAALTLRHDQASEPIVDVDGMDLTVRVQDSGQGLVLSVDPLDVFTRKKLTPKHCSTLLQLINPSLRDADQMEGEFSLSLEKLSVPLGVPREQLMERLEAQGELTLHQVSIETDNPLLQTLSKIVADVHHKQAPSQTRVVKDASIEFQARDGRLYHQGLDFGFPDIDPALQIHTYGSVGLDESLDAYLEVPRLDQGKQQQRGPIVCHVTGTVSNPQLSAKDASLVVRLPGRAEPLIDVDGVDFTVRVEKTAGGSMVSFDPVELLHREKLDRRLASSLLHLIDPELKYSPQLEGEVSLTLDTLRIPVGEPDDEWLQSLQVKGKLVVHQATSLTTSPIQQTIVKLVSDLYGKETYGAVRVSQDAEIDFELLAGRFHYDGLKVGFPDIDSSLEIRSRGSIGLDETLDMYVEIPRLDPRKQQQRGPILCHVTGTVSNPQMSVKDASLVVHLPDRTEPLIDVDGVDFTVRMEELNGGRVLAFEPFELLHRETLDRQLASSLLNLLDPELKYSPQLDGEVSLSLDTLRVPIGKPDEEWLQSLQVKGKLVVHQASSLATSPIRQAVVKLVYDLYGKQPPDVVRISHDTDVQFDLSNGRFQYEGLRVGFPDVDPSLQILSRGSIGLDETLDMYVEVPRLDRIKRQQRGSVKCHVTGTVQSPKFSIEDASLVVRLAGKDRPLLDIDAINLTMQVRQEAGKATLEVDPVKVFQHQELTPELSSELLSLVVPTLGDVADVKGEISMSLDAMEIPLSGSKSQILRSANLSGELRLHEISTTVKTPLLTMMVKMLTDRYGGNPSETVRVANDATIRFELRDGRLFHDGLRVGFPDLSPELVCRSSGSLGLDRSLDVVLDVPAILVSPVETPDTGATTIRFKVTGTIDEPQIVEIK